MPIYEYQAIKSEASCRHCRNGFEALRLINEKPLNKCPQCGQPVKKIISWCHSAIVETSAEHAGVVNKIKSVATGSRAGHDDVPKTPVVIEKAEVVEE